MPVGPESFPILLVVARDFSVLHRLDCKFYCAIDITFE